MSCADHRAVACRHCSNVVRQCQCRDGKPLEHGTEVCGVCRAQGELTPGDLRNCYEQFVSVEREPDFAFAYDTEVKPFQVPDGFVMITDAENCVVALVPEGKADVICRVLNGVEWRRDSDV